MVLQVVVFPIICVYILQCILLYCHIVVVKNVLFRSHSVLSHYIQYNIIIIIALFAICSTSVIKIYNYYYFEEF